MSTTIDEKVVSMQFDNKHFEQNVQTTMSTLDKLKKVLRLEGSAKAAQSEFESYSAGVSSLKDSILKSFSSLEYEMADKIKNITKWLSPSYLVTTAIDKEMQAISAGFDEYGLKMGSIQTIMASTGESLDKVNEKLGELNEYSDKTIYSFQDMTSNIGKFTNAGVNLEDSVAAIKGVSNVAAVSGANANEASRAMYNFAQALSSGYVKLIDWKSIENANMATVEFKEHLLEAAVAEGKLTKTSDGMYKTLKGTTISATKNFNDSLQEQWMTSEVLIGTLKEYSDETTEIGKKAAKAATEVKTFGQLFDTLKESAQSGWAQTWEIIIGDFEEAKKLLAGINEVVGGAIGAAAEARNELLENWKTLGGRDDLIEAFKNLFEGFKSIVTPIKEAFSAIFPPFTAEKLAGFTAGLKELTSKLTLNHVASDNLKRTFKGLFAVISIIGKVFSTIGKIIGKVLGVTDDLAGGILGITAVIGDWLVGLHEVIEDSNIFGAVLNGISAIVKAVSSVIRKLFNVLQNSFVFKVISAAVESFIAVLGRAEFKMERLSEVAGEVKEAWENSGLYKFLSALWGIIKTVISGISRLFKGLAESISNSFGRGDLASGFDIINTILSGGLLVAIGLFIKKIKDLFEAPKAIMESISEVFSNVAESISNFGKKTSSVADNIKAIALALVVLTVALLIISGIDTQKVANALAAIGFGIAEMIGAIFVVSKIGNLDKSYKAIRSMTSIAIAMLVLSFSIKKLGELDTETLIKGVLGSTAAMFAMAFAQKVLVQSTKGTDKKAVKKATNSLIAMAVALRVVAESVKIMGNMEWDVLGRGLLGITACLGVMGGIMTLLMWMSKGVDDSQIKQIGKSFVLMGISLVLMANAIRTIGKLEWDQMWRGLIGVGLCLGAIGAVLLAMRVLSKYYDFTNESGFVKAAGGILIMALAIDLLVPALLIFSKMSPEQLIQACQGLVAVLGALALAQVVMLTLGGTGGQLLKAAGSVAIMTFALNLILPTLLLIGMLPFVVIAQGLISLVAVLGTLVIAQILLTRLGGKGGKMLMAAGSIAIMAVALSLLVPSLVALGLFAIPAVVGIVVLASALLVLGAAAAIFKVLKLDIVLLVVAAALLAMSTAAVLAGVGLIAIGKGLVYIAAGLTALYSAVMLMVGETEVIFLALAKGIVVFFETLISAADVIVEFAIVLIKGLCRAIIECVPEIVDTLLQLVTQVLESLAKFTPKIVTALLELITNIITALAGKLPDLIKAVVDLFFALVEGVMSAIGGMDSSVLLDALLRVGMIAGIMLALSALPSLAPGAMLGVIAFGGIITELAFVLAAVGALTEIPGLNKFIEKGGDLLENVGNAIGRFIGGFIGGIAKGASSVLPEVGNDLSDFATNSAEFFKLVSTVTPDTMAGVKMLAEIIRHLTATNILDGLTSWFSGGSAIPKFGEDLKALGNGIRDYATAIGAIDTDGVKSAALNPEAITSSVTSIKEIIEAMNQLPDTGGLTGWLTGDKDLGEFAKSLTPLGEGMREFAEAAGAISTEGVDSGTIDFNILTNTITATKLLAEAMASLPETGGLDSIFTGSKSLASLGDGLADYGESLSDFSASLKEVDIGKINQAADASKALAEITNIIPNQNGIVQWFTGESSVSKFGDDLVNLGKGLNDFSLSITNVNPVVLSSVATAAKYLAEMTNAIPNEGGIKAWFSGESSLSKFSADLVSLGKGLKGFSDETLGINPETVTAAASAAKDLATLTEAIPNEGGMKSWFTGEASLSKFSADLVSLGKGLKGFSDETNGINSETVAASANAAKELAEMTQHVPKEGGIKAWFTGDSSIATFADKLPELGKGLKGFSDSVNGINTTNLSTASEAAKAIAEMCGNTLGEVDNIPVLSTNLTKLGVGMRDYFNACGSIAPESLSTTKNVLAEINNINNVNVGNINSVSNSIVDITEAIKGLATVPTDAAAGFSSALSDLGKVSVDSFLGSFKNLDTDMKNVGSTAIDSFISGVNKPEAIKAAALKVISSCLETMALYNGGFYDAGANAVAGFANGISENTFVAEAKAAAMAQASLDAAMAVLRERSPSRAFYDIGDYAGLGFVNALGDYESVSYKAGSTMANSATEGLSDALAKTRDIIESGMDGQPTIRPVLDLSDVNSGMSDINRLFDKNTSLGVLANVGGISASMRGHRQNGDTEQLASEIDKLSKAVKNMEHTTYNVNGITYEEGSDVGEALKIITREATMVRRK